MSDSTASTDALLPEETTKKKDTTEQLNTEDKLELVKRLLDEKKAVEVEVIKLRPTALIADYFVVCSGTSNTHIKAIADGLVVDGKPLGLRKQHMEGYSPAKWVLIDYGDVVVHIFSEDERRYYDIESLWKQTAVVIGEAVSESASSRRKKS